ncbi:MAG: hypothetical protein IPG50_30015 [Myxococcales bacterium]|nr:hypothetical protein [Myxococcales bacterium]
MTPADHVFPRVATLLATLTLVAAAHCSAATDAITPGTASIDDAGDEAADDDAGDETAGDAGAARDASTKDGAANKDGGAKDASSMDAAKVDASHDAAKDALIDARPPDAGTYPTAHLGTRPRAGTVAGDVIKNYGFTGYRAVNGTLDTSKLQTIHLADYYDPTGKKGLKVLHIIAAARWSSPDGAEVQAAVTATPALAAQGAVFLVAMGQGASVGASATKADLDAWVTKYGPHFSLALDPAFAALSDMWDVSAVPFNVDVDLRSMEILAADVGAPPDLAGTVQGYVDWVKTHPASWP